MGRRLGLIVGVNSYQDTTFRPLQLAETDARALAQWLVHNRGGNWNPADVQVVQGAEATRELVETLIAQVCLQMATSEDLILLYFAGYAFVDQANGDGYLACHNTRYQQSGSGINLLALVSQIMVRSPAAQILCILDVFQFGSVWSMLSNVPFDFKPLLGPTLLNGLRQMQGRLLYCTCRGNEMQPEMGEKNLGSFMYRTIMGVGGPAVDPSTGQITLQRLHAFLVDKLSEQHKPQVFGQEQRPLVLVGEMPAFKTGALRNAGPFPPPSGPLMGQPMQTAGSSVAQLSLSGMPSGQATFEQNRQQQSQQMLSKAMQVFQARDFQQAYQMVETILSMNPSFSDALILKAQILAATGQFREALNTVQEAVQEEPDNALGWSMAAALLANLGQLPEAMSAVDRSISIDPSNSETHSIKEMIREKLAEMQFDTGKRSRLSPDQGKKKSDTGKGLALAAGLQLLALLIGLAGAFLPLFVPALPFPLALGLESIALALLVVIAGRGAFLYGIKRFLLIIPFSLVAGALAAAIALSVNKTTPLTRFLDRLLAVSYAQLTPLAILIFWLVAAALVPLLAGLGGLIAGIIVRASRKKRT